MSSKSNLAGNITYDDLREWLSLAERLGEVRTVKGANCEEDIGLAAEAVLRAENGPCVVFEDIPGCAKGTRLLMNMFAGTRRNMTLGFPDHLTKWELSDAYREAYLQEQKIVPHEIVDDGPVLENVMMGDEVDVTQFPAPKWHEKDGGRYIGTGTYSITRDPEENWLNAGAYRAQVHDKKTVGMVMAAGHHGRIHRDKAFKRGEPMPVAMVLGGDPLAFFFGGLEAPYGVFELDLVGGLRGRPVKMVRGKVTGLPVSGQCRDRAGRLSCRPTAPTRKARSANGPDTTPAACANSGARHQGDLLPQRSDRARRAADGRRTRRDGALPRGDALGHHQAERHQCRRAGRARRSGATRSAARACCMRCPITQRYPGHAVQAAHIAAQCGASAYASKYIVVVDDDVDVTNLDHLLWAMLTRTDPKESIQFISGSWDSSADPRSAAGAARRRQHDAFGGADRRLQAVALARQVSSHQRAERGGVAQGTREVRLAAGREWLKHLL